MCLSGVAVKFGLLNPNGEDAGSVLKMKATILSNVLCNSCLILFLSMDLIDSCSSEVLEKINVEARNRRDADIAFGKVSTCISCSLYFT